MHTIYIGDPKGNNKQEEEKKAQVDDDSSGSLNLDSNSSDEE